MVSRRLVTTSALWTAPAVVVTAAAPALAASATALTVTSAVKQPMQYVGEPVSLPMTAVDQDGAAPSGAVWTVTGLPAGLTMSPDGLITGTPLTADASPITVTVTDVHGATATATLILPVGNDRTAVTTQMLARIDAWRATLGAPALTRDAGMDANITAWVDGLAAAGGGLVHQSPVVYAENLSATCGPADSLGSRTDTALGDALVDGWLAERHSYAEYRALIDAGRTAEAQDMFYGRGAYAADGASGHRINLENPAYTTIGLGMAASISGSACGGTWTTGEYGGIVLK